MQIGYIFFLLLLYVTHGNTEEYTSICYPNPPLTSKSQTQDKVDIPGRSNPFPAGKYCVGLFYDLLETLTGVCSNRHVRQVAVEDTMEQLESHFTNMTFAFPVSRSEQLHKHEQLLPGQVYFLPIIQSPGKTSFFLNFKQIEFRYP